MATARFDETHSPGARHATAWLRDPDNDLKGSEITLLTAVGCSADADLFTNRGYYGTSAEDLFLAVGLSVASTRRRLDRLVEVGALIKREGLAGQVRYWLPDEVRIASD